MPKLREEFLDDHRKGILQDPIHAASETAPATSVEVVRNVPVGQKFDGGKPPVHQGFEAYFPNAILAVASISQYGANKYKVSYEDKNWKRVEGAEGRYKDAKGRHQLYPSVLTEGMYDNESHLLHAAHEAWNAMAVLQLLLEKGTPLRDPKADCK